MIVTILLQLSCTCRISHVDSGANKGRKTTRWGDDIVKSSSDPKSPSASDILQVPPPVVRHSIGDIASPPLEDPSSPTGPPPMRPSPGNPASPGNIEDPKSPNSPGQLRSRSQSQERSKRATRPRSLEKRRDLSSRSAAHSYGRNRWV